LLFVGDNYENQGKPQLGQSVSQLGFEWDTSGVKTYESCRFIQILVALQNLHMNSEKTQAVGQIRFFPSHPG